MTIMSSDISGMLSMARSPIDQPRRIEEYQIEPVRAERSVLVIGDDVRTLRPVQIKIRISLPIRHLALHPLLAHSQVEAARVRLLDVLELEPVQSLPPGTATVHDFPDDSRLTSDRPSQGSDWIVSP
jgi:hypothetical protein